MKLCLEETWEVFEKEAGKSKNGIILFGASSCAAVFINKIKITYKIKYLVDNDKKKQEIKSYSSYDVLAPEILKEEDGNQILLITSTYYSDIIEQLDRIGFKGIVYSFLHLRNKVEQNLDLKSLDSNITKLKELMFDSKSKDIIDAIYQKRITNNLDYSDISEENQYFLEGIVKKDKEAVFVDGGAYNGETVMQFIEFQSNCFKHVYSFEMDQDNFDKIDRNQFDSRISFFNYGLWDQNKTVSFISSSRSSEIAEEGNSVAECVALDDIIKEKVTFIKMDIEGAEQKALKGARRIITEDKPQLAICLYHSFADLWEIAFLLHNMVPDYKFYIRHHSNTYEETVLYATI